MGRCCNIGCLGFGSDVADGPEGLDQMCTGELLVCWPVFKDGCDKEILGAVFCRASDAERGICGVVGIEQVEGDMFTSESVNGLGFDVKDAGEGWMGCPTDEFAFLGHCVPFHEISREGLASLVGVCEGMEKGEGRGIEDLEGLGLVVLCMEHDFGTSVR